MRAVLRQRPRPINDELLRKLWVTRMPEQQIAEKIGHSASAVRRRAIKIGLSRYRRHIWERS